MTTPRITFGCNFSVEEYWDVVEFAQKAEELGFDRITTGEHIMDGNPPPPNPVEHSADGGGSRGHQDPPGDDRNCHCAPLPPGYAGEAGNFP